MKISNFNNLRVLGWINILLNAVFILINLLMFEDIVISVFIHLLLIVLAYWNLDRYSYLKIDLCNKIIKLIEEVNLKK